MPSKILFLIHDLGQGGAEKVLVNLVNNMDRTKFDITVMALFGGGVNEAFLKKDVRLINCHKKAFRGNSHLMKLLTPRQLYRHYIKECYDIVVSYLEGPCARIVSGCDDPDTKKVAWIHGTLADPVSFCAGFRSLAEARRCYRSFERRIFVSEDTEKAFCAMCPETGHNQVLRNVLLTRQIRDLAQEEPELPLSNAEYSLIGIGKLTANKGFDRLLRIHKRLREEGLSVCTYITGDGEDRGKLEAFVEKSGLCDSVKLLGYQTNPYSYLKRCSVFVCASYSEGFSTAATEALILGVPVCTVKVAGMREMLGAHNEYGIVTENEDEALYQGIKRLLDDPALLNHYREQAALRGKEFRTENTVRAVENMLEEVLS